jgi:hypothetical protein
VALVALGVVACSNDFDVFTPLADGGIVPPFGADGSTTGDGSVVVGRDGAVSDARDGASFDGPAGDGGTCGLMPGATMCCGSLSCVNAGGQCAQQCGDCVTQCNDPRRRVCCARSGGRVDCERSPQDC